MYINGEQVGKANKDSFKKFVIFLLFHFLDCKILMFMTLGILFNLFHCSLCSFEIYHFCSLCNLLAGAFFFQLVDDKNILDL